MDLHTFIKSLKPNLRFAQNMNPIGRWEIRNYTPDFNVKLSFGILLQRGLVWSDYQKEELIWSIFKGTSIPPIAIVMNPRKSTMKIIDGKQRMTSWISFMNNEFQIFYNNIGYFFTDLQMDYPELAMIIETFSFNAITTFCSEEADDPLPEKELIKWFLQLNYAGTPQDLERAEILMTYL